MKRQGMIITIILSTLILSGGFSILAQEQAGTALPRPEHPRPQFERSAWINLNGPWTYAFDFGASGKQRGFTASHGFADKIIVPFCPESRLSGVGHTDFINNIWYQRSLPALDSWKGRQVILHFGAVYYKTEVYIDDHFVGRHFGGTSSFDFDITRWVDTGARHNLVVFVNNELRSGKQPGGKQCFAFNSEGCSYTRTTGIWQTVWLEAVAPAGLRSAHTITDLDQKQLVIYPDFYAENRGNRLRVILKDKDKIVAEKTVTASNSSVCVLPVPAPHAWSPEDPFLYELQFEVTDKEGKRIDLVKSYAGMRKVNIEGDRVFLNNKPYYQRLVLNQGFYPDGIWTAPDDAALRHDIELSMQAGFNGARLHQKVFEERFHYWADKLGFLDWAESASWGLESNNNEAYRNFMTEWAETVKRDRDHPSIITWTPFNETWSPDEEQYPRMIRDMYALTKELDPTRPFNDASGGTHVLTDLWTVHNYEQSPAILHDTLAPAGQGLVWNGQDVYLKFARYTGQPYLLDEYGGTRLTPKKAETGNAWGYAELGTAEEFYDHLKKLTDTILSVGYISGYCYTQFTDVEQEQNGIFFYDRSPKFDMKKIHAIFGKNSEGFQPSAKEK